MTEATEIYDTCMSTIAAKAVAVQVRHNVLLIVSISVAAVIIVVIFLCWFH